MSYPRDTKTVHISIQMVQKSKTAPATRSSSNIQPQKSSSTKAHPSWLELNVKTCPWNHNRKFAIFSSDSINAIASILNQWTNNTTIQSIKNNNSITVIWFPSHTGIEMNERANKAAKEAANSTISYLSTSLPVYLKQKITLLVHLKQKMKHHWNNEWKTLVKPRLPAIKNDLQERNTIHSEKTWPSRNIKNNNRTYENNTQIHTHQRRPTILRTVQDDPNNRPPHTAMRSITTARKTTQSQAHPKRQPNVQWNIIESATISETHQDLQQRIKKSLLLLSLITHEVDVT